jgi:hypothetical protein
MDLDAIFKSVQSSVGRFGAAYAEGRAEEPALAPFATAGDVLSALARPADFEAKDAIVAALAARQQRAPHPLWQAILATAFRPMLLRLRGRLGKRGDDELDQRVLVAFLEAVAALRKDGPTRCTSLALRWNTEKALFGGLRADRRAAAPLCDFDDDTFRDPFAGAKTSQEDEASAAEVIRILESDPAGAEVRDMLVAKAGDESLLDYVGRAYVGRDARARAAQYERLRRARDRVVTRIRARLGARRAAA